MIYSWKLTFSTEDPKTGGAKPAYSIVRAPTAADAITMFEHNMKMGAPSPPPRYFRGAESIEIVEPPKRRRRHPWPA